MLGLRHLYKNIYPLFRLAEVSGTQIRVHHKKQIYLVTVQPTGEKYIPQPYKKQQKKKGIELIAEECERCGYMRLEDICINANCPSNQPE